MDQDNQIIKKEKRKPGKNTQGNYNKYNVMFKDIQNNDPKVYYDALSAATYTRGKNPTPKKYSQLTILNIMSAYLWKLRQDNIDDCNKDIIFSYSEFINSNLVDSHNKRDASKKGTSRTTKNTLRKAVIKDASFKFDEYVNSLNHYLDNNSGHVSYKYWVISNLYILTVPRRVLDYAVMKFAKTIKDTSDTNFNYFVSSTNLFVFNQYKTAYAYGQEKIKVPSELAKLLKDYVKRDNLHSGQLMFNNEMYIHRAIKDVFNTTVNHIRKAQNIKFYGGKSKAEIQEHAKMMGHSVLTGIRQYLD